jgi:hypothetical protein
LVCMSELAVPADLNLFNLFAGRVGSRFGNRPVPCLDRRGCFWGIVPLALAGGLGDAIM